MYTCMYVCMMHHIVFFPKNRQWWGIPLLTIEVVVGWFGSHVEERDESEDDKGQ